MAATIRVVILIGELIASCVSAKIVIEACHLVVYYSILSIRNAMFNEIGIESKMFEYINLNLPFFCFPAGLSHCYLCRLGFELLVLCFYVNIPGIFPQVLCFFLYSPSAFWAANKSKMKDSALNSTNKSLIVKV